MNEIITNENIENLIYEVRGKQIMLDSDLARIYECANGTKTINQAVNRHLDRFPEDFYFQLTDDEFKNLWSQVGTANKNNMSRTLPYAFTEQGVAMLASILRTNVAASVSVNIMRAFVKMRHYINDNSILPHRFILLEDKVDSNTKRIDELFDRFDSNPIDNNLIFFEGQHYEAYSLLIDIFNTANKEIIIIDNYAGKELLDLLKDIDKKIIIVSKNIDDFLKKKYEKQFDNITFMYNNSFHDRFIIIDRSKLYACGASLKDLGKKCSYIGVCDNEYYLNEILKIIL